MSLIKALCGGWDRAETITLPLSDHDPAARSEAEAVGRGLLKKLFQWRR